MTDLLRRFNAPNDLQNRLYIEEIEGRNLDLIAENERLRSLVVSITSGGVVALCGPLNTVENQAHSAPEPLPYIRGLSDLQFQVLVDSRLDQS